MPAFLGHHDHGRGGIEIAVAFDGERSLLDDGAFDDLAFGIETVELAGEFGGFLGIVGRQEARAQIRASDAATGIDPRPKDETGLEHAGGVHFGSSHLHQRREAGIAPDGHHPQAMGGHGAVESDELGDIADRS